MIPRRFESKWRGYKVAYCRVSSCRAGGVVNFDGLCRGCNDLGPSHDFTAPERKARSDENIKRNPQWNSRMVVPKRSAPRALPRGGRASD